MDRHFDLFCGNRLRLRVEQRLDACIVTTQRQLLSLLQKRQRNDVGQPETGVTRLHDRPRTGAAQAVIRHVESDIRLCREQRRRLSKTGPARAAMWHLKSNIWLRGEQRRDASIVTTQHHLLSLLQKGQGICVGHPLTGIARQRDRAHTGVERTISAHVHRLHHGHLMHRGHLIRHGHRLHHGHLRHLRHLRPTSRAPDHLRADFVGGNV